MLRMRYTKRTVESYVRWFKYFMIYYKKQHSSELGSNEARPFMTHVALIISVKEDFGLITENSGIPHNIKDRFWIDFKPLFLIIKMCTGLTGRKTKRESFLIILAKRSNFFRLYK